MQSAKPLILFKSSVNIELNSSDCGEPFLVQETVNELLQLTDLLNKPVKVIGVCGPKRAAKTSLANYLAQSVSFEVGHSFESKTKGIWLFVVDKQDHSLIILDSEGFDEASTAQDQLLFIILYFLCSFLVFNTSHVPTRQNVQDLQFLAEFKSKLLVSEASTHNKSIHPTFLNSFGPNFLWLIRDKFLNIPNEFQDMEDFMLRVVLAKSNDGKDHLRENILTIFNRVFFDFLPVPGEPSFQSKLEHVTMNVILANVPLKKLVNPEDIGDRESVTLETFIK